MILTEMVHDARVVRMNGTHPPAGMRKWFGDSIGRWEGDTLVIETTNFHPKHGFRNSWENLKVTERLSRKDAQHHQLPLHRRGSDDVHGAVHRRAGVQRDGAGRDGLRIRVPRSQLRPRRRDERRARAGARSGEEEDAAAIVTRRLVAHARGPDRPREGAPQSRSHAGGGECPRHSPPAALQDPQESADRAAGRSSAAPIGICCAKLGEAEVFADAGIADIRLPYPLNPVERRSRDRAARPHAPVVHRRSSGGGEAVVGGDDASAASRSTCSSRSTSASIAAASIPTRAMRVAMIQRRRRVAGLAASRACSRTPATPITRTPRTSCGRWRRTRRGRCATSPSAAARAACTIEEVSAGATPPARFSLQQDGFTEYRPGNYVYFDRTQVALGAATLDDCALTVLATVVSKPAPDRVIFDSGSKTLTNDGARGFTPAPGYGVVVGHDEPADRAAVGRARDGEGR